MLRVEVADRTAEFATIGTLGEVACRCPCSPPARRPAGLGRPVVGGRRRRPLSTPTPRPSRPRAGRLARRSSRASDLDALAASSVPAAGTLALEALRIAAWRPRLATEVDERTIPHELDWLRSAVHLAKGCYRGQETVAKVHNLGHPPRRLVMLHLDGSDVVLPAHGDQVVLARRHRAARSATSPRPPCTTSSARSRSRVVKRSADPTAPLAVPLGRRRRRRRPAGDRAARRRRRSRRPPAAAPAPSAAEPCRPREPPRAARSTSGRRRRARRTRRGAARDRADRGRRRRASYSIAHYGLGHAVPLLAVTVVDHVARLRAGRAAERVLETPSASCRHRAERGDAARVGKGLWQFAVVLLVVLVVARFASPNAAFAVAAAIQCDARDAAARPRRRPVHPQLDGSSGASSRSLVTALMPRDPSRLVRARRPDALRRARGRFAALVEALAHRRRPPGRRGARAALRATQPLVGRLGLDARVGRLDRADLAVPALAPARPAAAGQDAAPASTSPSATCASSPVGSTTRSATAATASRLADAASRASRPIGGLLGRVGRRRRSSVPVARRRPHRGGARRLDPAVVAPRTRPSPSRCVVLMMRPLVVRPADGDRARPRRAPARCLLARV